VEFGRLPDTLIPSENPMSVHERQRIHNTYQRKKVKEGWQKEIAVDLQLSCGGIDFSISGRMDLLLDSNDSLKIVEVKTIRGAPDFTDPVESRINNVLQLYFYAKAFSAEKDIPLERIKCSLVYLTIDGKDPVEYPFDICLTDGKLGEAWQNLLGEISKHIVNEDIRKEAQISTLENFKFPYESLRPGQLEMLGEVNRCIDEKSYLMLQAPTGTGKTAAVLSGALAKTIPDRATLFFLTAKNTHKLIVEETLRLVIEKGVPLRGIFITAKSMMCHRGRKHCFPDDCPYASDFGAKVRSSGVMNVLLDLQLIGPDVLGNEAESAGVCAFELGLFLAMHCDIIVCDYNYVFDPHVFLKRFFLERNTSVLCSLLIDEAANLPSRARDYYSPEIRLSWIRELLEDSSCPSSRKKLLTPWTAGFDEWTTLLDCSGKDEIEIPPDTDIPLNKDRWISHMNTLREPSDVMLDMFRSVIDFSKISGVTDERYHLLFRREKDDMIVQWFCTDPSEFLNERLEACHSTTAFSATLTPFDHFGHLLGFPEPGSITTKKIAWPFPRDNLGVWICSDIDTRYKARNSSAEQLADRISMIYRERQGTWLVFFPSYAYLQQISLHLQSSGLPLLIQTPGMGREDRIKFIEEIESGDQLALTVSGGIFSEGIDLRSENLLGAIIVGPSLPGMNLRQKLLSESYSRLGRDGFIHTWAIPGMVRVIQAAGRLIRNSTERKALVLIGRRFSKYPYVGLLPEHWFRNGSIQLLQGSINRLSAFFENRKSGAKAPPSI